MPTIEINNSVHARIERKKLQKVFQGFIRVCRFPQSSSVSLAFVSSGVIRQLNKKYRKKNQSTDVLSFAFHRDKEIFSNQKKNDIGEVIVCYPVARYQAEKAGHSVAREIQILFLHGLLHIAGHDHQTKKQRKAMQPLEREILKKTGVYNNSIFYGH